MPVKSWQGEFYRTKGWDWRKIRDGGKDNNIFKE